MEYCLTKPTKNSLNGLLSTNYIITNWENIEMSGSKKYLENMTEITVKEVHMYFYSSKMLGYQFFYQHNDQTITYGLISDFPEKYHKDLINLGCSEEELEKEKVGMFYKTMTLNDLQVVTTSKKYCKGNFGLPLVNVVLMQSLSKENNNIEISKSIFRPDIENNEFIRYTTDLSPFVYVSKDYHPVLITSKGKVYSLFKCDSFDEKIKGFENNDYKFGTSQICGFEAAFVEYESNNKVMKSIPHVFRSKNIRAYQSMVYSKIKFLTLDSIKNLL